MIHGGGKRPQTQADADGVQGCSDWISPGVWSSPRPSRRHSSQQKSSSLAQFGFASRQERPDNRFECDCRQLHACQACQSFCVVWFVVLTANGFFGNHRQF